MTARSPPPRAPSTRRWLLLMLPAPAMLIVATLWLQVEYRRSERVRAEAAASFESRMMLTALLAQLAGAEARPATQARATERLVAALSQRGEDMTTVAPLVTQRLAEIARMPVANDSAVMARLRALVEQRIASEHRETNERQTTFTHQRARLYTILTAIGALLLAVLLGAQAAMWRFSRRSFRSAMQRYEAAERTVAILDGTHDALLIVAPDGRIDMANPAAAILLHCPQEALAGTALSTVIDLGETLPGPADAPVMLTDRPAQRCDGTTITVDLALGTMQVPSGEHMIVSLRDMSDRKRMEQAKDELIATISHELRTPLTSVIGSLTLLRIGTGNDLSPDARRLVDIADANSRRLIRLINDLLDFDRIEAGKLTMICSSLDLRDVLDEARRGAEGLAQSASVTLTCSLPDTSVRVHADAGRLQQVIANLLANAIRVAPDGSRVLLGLVADGERAVVRVEDRGPGIPADFRDRIFDRFETRSLDRHGEGTGLGLAISREIVLRHDGAIWFEDRPGGGTRFSFALPLRKDDPLRDAAATGQPAILHLDDDDDLRATVSAAIGSDAEVIGVGNLAAARVLLKQRIPALAILDMQVVDGHGSELIPLLIDAAGRPIPTIVLSGADVPVDVAERADAVLRKGEESLLPLLAAVRGLLARAGR